LTKKAQIRRGGWAVDKTLPSREEAALYSAIFHAVGLDFPHYCDHNNAENAQVGDLDGNSGTQTIVFGR